MATTTLKTSTLPREFVFSGARIPDPDPHMSIDQVRDLLTPSYPEIATATMTGPEDTGTGRLPAPIPATSVHSGDLVEPGYGAGAG
jgi:PRTRC genetic system protein C